MYNVYDHVSKIHIKCIDAFLKQLKLWFLKDTNTYYYYYLIIHTYNILTIFNNVIG